MYKIDRRGGGLEGVQKSFSRKLPNCIIRIEYNLDLIFLNLILWSLYLRSFYFQEFVSSGVCLVRSLSFRSLSFQDFVFQEFVFQEFVFQEFVIAPYIETNRWPWWPPSHQLSWPEHWIQQTNRNQTYLQHFPILYN